jgi:hypothetical protein
MEEGIVAMEKGGASLYQYACINLSKQSSMGRRFGSCVLSLLRYQTKGSVTILWQGIR